MLTKKDIFDILPVVILVVVFAAGGFCYWKSTQYELPVSKSPSAQEIFTTVYQRVNRY